MIIFIQRLFPIIIFAIVVGMLPACAKEAADPAATAPRLPYPARVHYPSDLSVPDHISPRQQDLLIIDVYERWKTNYLSIETDQETGQKNHRITAGKKKRALTFSEGQGYGMMLTAYMAGHDPEAQIIFDGLYRFSRQNPSRNEQRFMAYQVPVKDSRRTSAFDGDADIAFALLLANEQWGSGGAIDYLQEARELIDTLSRRVVGRDSRLPLLGDWVTQEGKKYNQHSVRSSDIMPGHFKVFKEVTGDPVWEIVTQRSQTLIDLLQINFSPESGLVPDFIVRSAEGTPEPAPPRFLESVYDGSFYYNAARVPWRLAEAALVLDDPTSYIQLQKMAKWILHVSSGDPTKIGPGFYLDGRRIGNEDYMSMAFIGPFGLAAMTLKDQQRFVNRVFDLCVRVEQDYYEDTISLFCLLLMSGNYWLPTLNPDVLLTDHPRSDRPEVIAD